MDSFDDDGCLVFVRWRCKQPTRDSWILVGVGVLASIVRVAEHTTWLASNLDACQVAALIANVEAAKSVTVCALLEGAFYPATGAEWNRDE